MRSLGALELFNATWIPLVVVFHWVPLDLQSWLVRAPSLVLVTYILIQGGLYWVLKAHALQAGKRQMPGFFLPLFLFFQRSNLVLFGGYFVLLIAVSIQGNFELADIFWGVGLFAFALLEHVNYYAYQLMHDTFNDILRLCRTRRLRRAALRQDLEFHIIRSSQGES